MKALMSVAPVLAIVGGALLLAWNFNTFDGPAAVAAFLLGAGLLVAALVIGLVDTIMGDVMQPMRQVSGPTGQ